MAVWSAQGFLFLSGSRSCARSRLHRPQPQEHTGASSAAGTLRHAQVGGKGTPLRGWGVVTVLLFCRVLVCAGTSCPACSQAPAPS